VQDEPARQFDAAIPDMVLRELALHLAHLNSSHDLAAFGLPTPAAQPASAVVADEIARYDVATQATIRDERVPQLNLEQRAVYDNVMAVVDYRAFFVDGLGGIGKTFLYSCLLSTVRAQGRVAIAVASSGIVALLLDGGRTAHSRFKIPVQDFNSTSTCYISRDSDLAALLIEEVYGALSSIVEYAARSAYIIERAILTPLNENVDALNKLINDTYAFTKHDGSPAQHHVYYSADSVMHGEQHGIYPTEFLNTLSFPGVPPHELHLQEGCPIILLRNMTNDLANGTRLIVIQLMQHVIEAEVATGPAKGQ
jgi:hypothetical protein